MSNLITGLFDTESAAENAVTQLKQIGYTESEISIIMKDPRAAADLAAEAGTGSRTMESVGTGAAIGGTIGAILAGLLAVGTVAIPGVGLLAAGPLAAMFAGAGAGGLAGSLLGWMVGAGIPEDVAPYYERGLSEGGVVVAVATHAGDETRVQQILHGGAVAYAGHNTQAYVAPAYVSRHMDIPAPTVRSYDTDTVAGYTTAANSLPEANRTVNAIGAEQRSADRTASEHEREARRDAFRTDPVSGTVAAVENEADRAKTALQNQGDKLSTATENTTERLTNP